MLKIHDIQCSALNTMFRNRNVVNISDLFTVKALLTLFSSFFASEIEEFTGFGSVIYPVIVSRSTN